MRQIANLLTVERRSGGSNPLPIASTSDDVLKQIIGNVHGEAIPQ